MRCLLPASGRALSPLPSIEFVFAALALRVFLSFLKWRSQRFPKRSSDSGWLGGSAPKLGVKPPFD